MKQIFRPLLRLWNVCYNYYQKDILKLSHQRLDMMRTESKWQIIKPFIIDRTGTMLDIGCNEGYFSLEVAKLGWKVRGVDLNENAVSYARRMARSAGLFDSLSYDIEEITMSYLKSLPRFDGVLMLSMLQEIYSALGHDESMKIFHETLRHCNDFLLFETATTKAKYANSSKVFLKDNDKESITYWVESLVQENPDWRVQYVGRTAYTSQEPYRFMYLFQKS